MFSKLTLAALAACLAAPIWAQTAEELAAQAEAYEAVRPKSILELQPFRRETTQALGDTGRAVTLIETNPRINDWMLLRLAPVAGKGTVETYHLENPNPKRQAVTLAPGPVLTVGGTSCTPWAGEAPELKTAAAKGLPFAPLCGGKLYLRTQVSGSRTSIEATTDFLRDHVWGGESIVRFVRDNFYKDSQLASGETVATNGAGVLAAGPGAAKMDMAVEDRPVFHTLLDIALQDTQGARVTAGLWYPVAALPGVYASALQPRWISQEVLKGPGTANWLDGVESRADAYLVGFDMSRFDVHYAVGTDHPALGWSPRPPYSVRPRGMPGPDGVQSATPLVRLGMVPPNLADRTVASFTGGFKRQHGAFKWGDYITLNYGTHYGFLEHGTLLSKLWPHLSTLYVLDDGTWGMKTWTQADAALLPRLRYARQNGVPIIENGIPAPLVTKWGPGNWSGSAKAELRTLRAGACRKRHAGKDWLIYGYFSTATPSAMARTFQAYGCDYAMLLDMNALEHSYLALYVRHAGKLHVEHMVPGMGLIEKKSRSGDVIPRFLGFVDNRDLFYLTLKEEAEE